MPNYLYQLTSFENIKRAKELLRTPMEERMREAPETKSSIHNVNHFHSQEFNSRLREVCLVY